MNRIIGFTENDLSLTLRRIDSNLDILMRHNLPLIYEYIIENKENNYVLELFENMVKKLENIESHLTDFDTIRRNAVSMKELKKELEKIKNERNVDSLY